MYTHNEVLCHPWDNMFIENYPVWRFPGEDDNLIQVNHDITSTCIFGEFEGSIRDLFVDVADVYV